MDALGELILTLFTRLSSGIVFIFKVFRGV